MTEARWRPAWFVIVLALASGVSLLAASGAQAYVYWTNTSAGSIGRANLDGSGVNHNFITGLNPGEVAVDHGHVYWTNGTSIGRANLNGSGKNVNFIQGLSGPSGDVAVYHVKRPTANCEDIELQWTNSLDNAIGRATAPGCSCQGSALCVTPSFITGLATTPLGVAVDAQNSVHTDGNGGHVYWTTLPGASTTGSIGRANLDGSGVDHSFIAAAANSVPEGVAATTGAGGKVFWTNRGLLGGGSIGRANLDGSAVNQNFITGASLPEGVAVDGAHVYWVNHGTNTIGRANLDGSGVNQNFVTGVGDLWGIAVDTRGPPLALAPQLTRVTQSAARWRAGNALPRTARARAPVGTTFAFTLDRPARVQFLFTRTTVGRRVGGRCVAQTIRNRSRPRCLRTVRVAFSRRARTGRTRLRFQGRVTRSRRLAPGRYKLLITATADGRRSRPAVLRFSILPYIEPETP